MSTMTSLWGTQKPAKGKRFGVLRSACKDLGCIFLRYWQFSSQKAFSFCHFGKSNQPIHKSEAFYWHKRDWSFMEKLYLYFDQLWPVSWQQQHRFLLCSAVHHGLAQNLLFQSVVRTALGRLILVALKTVGDTFSGQQKPALAHSFLRSEHAFILDLSPDSKETFLGCVSSCISGNL